MGTDRAPVLGAKPYWICAWQRIGELVGAIERHYEDGQGDASLCEMWAEEIVVQCQIIQIFSKKEKELTNE